MTATASPSPAEMIHSPERLVTPWQFLLAHRESAARFSIGDITLDYRGLADRADRLAGGLRDIGIEPGDRVASIMADCMEVAELLLACLRLGAVYVPLSPYLKGNFLSYQIDHAAPQLLVVDGPGLDATMAVLNGLTAAPMIRLIAGASTATQSLASLYLAEPLDGASAVTDGRTIGAMLFTSGTTGMPKACLLSQAYLAKVGAVMCEHWRLNADDLVMTCFPLFHGAGLVGTVMMALAGGAGYHNVARFHASRFMADAAERGATIVIGPGAAGQAMLAQAPCESDRRNRLRLAAFSPFPGAAQDAFTARFGTPVWVESYGQTECMLIAMSTLNGPRSSDSVGMPSPLVEVSVHDDDDEPVPRGAAGEIVVRPRTSGAMFAGYWRNPEATLERWSGLWHHTGDYGLITEKGFIKFLDRKKDALRRRGENVSSAELEAAIALHPCIASVAVHAVPSDMTEDEIKACIVLRPDAETSAEDLFRFFRQTLPYFAIPRFVEILDALPMTGSMKVQKEILRTRGVASSWDLEALGFQIARDERRQVARQP